MGNSASSEQPRRAPQKLSKPRVGNHVASANNLLSPNASSPTVARFSNSYLVGSPPVPSPETFDPHTGPGQVVSREDIREDIRATDDVVAHRDAAPEVGLVRSSTAPLQPQRASRRKSTGLGLATAKTFDGVNRPRSMVHHGGLSPLIPTAGPEGLASPKSSHHDLASPDLQRAASVSPGNMQSTSPVPSSHQLDEPRGEGPHQQPVVDTHVNRSQSDVSLYAPARRRSAILTPGVATRSEPIDVTSPSTKASFRKSVPPTLNESRQSSPESLSRRHLSMAPRSSSDAPERVATPSEADYRQIGGIKFGSLRITNGTPSSSPGPEQGSRSSAKGSPAKAANNLEVPGSEGAVPDNPGSPAGELKQPKPLSGTVSPVMATFGDASPNGMTASDTCSPFSETSEGWKSGGLSPLSPATQPSAAVTPENLVVDEDSGKSSENPAAPDEKRKSTAGVARSDSGFGSSSSSDSQQERLSKPDSGYSSSLSLKSLFGSKKSAKQAKDNNASQTIPLADAGQEKRPGLKHHGQYQPNQPTKEHSTQVNVMSGQTATGENDAEKGQNHVASLSRASSFLGSFKTRKSRETLTGHFRGRSVPDVPSRDVPAEKPTSSSGTSTGSHKPKKLSKIISSARRRSLPNLSPSQPQQGEVPSMPSDAAEKLQEHSRNFDEASKQPSFRVNATKDPPKSPVRAEAKEFSEQPIARRTTPGVDRPPRPKSTGPFPHSLDRSASAMSTRSPTHRKSVLRKSRPAVAKPTGSDNEEGLPDYVLGYEAQVASIDSIRRSAGNSAFDAAFVPMAEDNVMGPQVRKMPPPRSVPRAPPESGAYPRLRTRSSAPDFLETVSEPASPGAVDCYSQKKPKTPPPISIRTRGSKKKKRSSRSSHSAPFGARHEAPPPMPDINGHDGKHIREQELRQSLRSFPVPRAPGGPDMPGQDDVPETRPEPGAGYSRRQSARPYYPPPTPRSESSAEMGRYPAHPPRDGRAPPLAHSVDNDEPPYRVLHSYNSPAYRGVPIWS